MEMNPGASASVAARWSWVVFRDKGAVEPLERDGQLLACRGHGIGTGSA